MGLFDMCCPKKPKKSLDYMIKLLENADKRFEDIDTYLENLNTAINGDNGLDSRVSSLEVALGGKQDTLTFDSTPTADSTNPVTSGGVKAALDGKTGISRGNNGWVEVTANGQVQVIGDQSVFIGISDMDGAHVTLDNIANLKRALSDPDTTPTANSNKLVTSGGVNTALGGKASINHTHTPNDVLGAIPSFVEWTGQTLDLDQIIGGTWGMVRIMLYNNDSTDTTFGDLFESLDSLPIHLNVNAATTIETQHYALCTIYKMDKSQTPSEHDHELCYFITLDGVFDNGNQVI